MSFNLPVVTEDDHTHVVGFEVEGHASDSRPELHHLACLHLAEAHHTRNTVSDADHCPELFHVVLRNPPLTTWLKFRILSWMTLAVSAIPSFFEENWNSLPDFLSR